MNQTLQTWIDELDAEVQGLRAAYKQGWGALAAEVFKLLCVLVMKAIYWAMYGAGVFCKAFYRYVILPTDGAIRAHLSAREFVDAVVAAFAAGGGLANVLIYLAANVQSWLPGVPDSSLVVVATVLTFVARLIQRYYQGSPKPGKDLQVKSRPFVRLPMILALALSAAPAGVARAQCAGGSCPAPSRAPVPVVVVAPSPVVAYDLRVRARVVRRGATARRGPFGGLFAFPRCGRR